MFLLFLFSELPFSVFCSSLLLYKQVTKREASALEKATKGQSSSKKWHEEREWRLTASRFGEICSITARRNIKKLCLSLLGNQEIFSPALTHGKVHEPIAIKAFEKVSIVFIIFYLHLEFILTISPLICATYTVFFPGPYSLLCRPAITLVRQLSSPKIT